MASIAAAVRRIKSQRAGLIQERAGKQSTTLGDFLNAYIASRIDAKHYLQITDDHFDRAVSVNSSHPETKGIPEFPGVPEATQKTTPHLHADAGRRRNGTGFKSEKPLEISRMQAHANSCDHPDKYLMTGEGLEPSTNGLKGRCSTN